MVGGGCDANGEGRDGCSRAWCRKCYPEVRVNDLCTACGKPPHFGGCKLGPSTQADNEVLKKYAARRDPTCGICPSTEHETADCPRASSPRKGPLVDPNGSIFLDPPEQVEEGRQDFLDIGGLHPAMADLLRECVKVQSTKGRDYTEGSNDRLNNFREAAEETDEPMEKVWYVYFFKHWKAVRSWVRFGQVESEPIRGRIVDCINYLLLLWLIVREKDPDQN